MAHRAHGLSRLCALAPSAVLLMLMGCGVVRGGRMPSDEFAVPQRYPRDAPRFSLRVLSDSTVSFRQAEASWVRVGMSAIAVDPAQGDALVARLRLIAVAKDSAIALVTGQTTRVSGGQVLLLVPPALPWWRQRLFWYGAASGAAMVALAATAFGYR
jgi:hypothetical protein